MARSSGEVVRLQQFVRLRPRGMCFDLELGQHLFLLPMLCWSIRNMISTTLCDSVVCCCSRMTLPRATDHYNGVEWADMFVDYVAHHMKRLGLVKGGETAYAPREYEIAVQIMQAKFSEIESMLEYWASASLSWSAPPSPPARSSQTKHHIVCRTVAPLNCTSDSSNNIAVALFSGRRDQIR